MTTAIKEISRLHLQLRRMLRKSIMAVEFRCPITELPNATKTRERDLNLDPLFGGDSDAFIQDITPG